MKAFLIGSLIALAMFGTGILLVAVVTPFLLAHPYLGAAVLIAFVGGVIGVASQ